MKSLIFCFAAFLSLISCKNDTPSTENAASPVDTLKTDSPANTNAAPDNSSKAEGKVVSLQGGKLKLDNNTEIALPGSKDKTTVIFFARHAESIPGKTSLSTEGQARSGALAMLFGNTGLARAFASDNASLQTALPPSRANGIELEIYKPDDATFLTKVLKDNQSKKLLIVGTPETLTGFLAKLGGLVPFAETEYDNLYVAFIKDAGAAEIRHFKY